MKINKDLKQKIIFKFIKSINILYVGILYMIFGGSFAFIVNYIYPERSEKISHNLDIVQLGVETILMASSLFLMVYYVRTLVKWIGSPFNNIAGFDFYRLKELGGGVVLSLSLIMFSNKLINMAKVFSIRMRDMLNEKKDN